MFSDGLLNEADLKQHKGIIMTNHVELRNVTKQFGSQKAVNQVDLVLKAGESVGMAGHNGAGNPPS